MSLYELVFSKLVTKVSRTFSVGGETCSLAIFLCQMKATDNCLMTKYGKCPGRIFQAPLPSFLYKICTGISLSHYCNEPLKYLSTKFFLCAFILTLLEAVNCSLRPTKKRGMTWEEVIRKVSGYFVVFRTQAKINMVCLRQNEAVTLWLFVSWLENLKPKLLHEKNSTEISSESITKIYLFDKIFSPAVVKLIASETR